MFMHGTLVIYILMAGSNAVCIQREEAIGPAKSESQER